MEITTEEVQTRVALFGAHTKALTTFFEEFTSSVDITEDDGVYTPWGDKKYKNQLQEIKNGTTKVLKVFVDDIRQYFLKDQFDHQLYEGLMLNTFRYLEILYSAADAVIETLEKGGSEGADAVPLPNLEMLSTVLNPIDELREGRMKQNKLPVYLRANFEIVIIPGESEPIKKMKSVNADCVGSLSLIEVDVTRIGNVKPRIRIATYECDNCHNHSYKAVEGPTFMPITDCVNCISTKNAKGTLKFHPKLSKFEKYQELRVQEPLVHLSDGELPKSLKCEVSGELTQKLKPGDSVLLYGILLPVTQNTYTTHKFVLLADKVFKILYLKQLKKSADKGIKMHSDLARKIEELKSDPEVYERLAYSIAPEIYGHEDVKKALLLQLIGGCTREKNDGGFIRGNIHILLLGDPGVAKSQLLKKVSAISTRGVYTTGKGSSSTGLTAGIIKDSSTGETVLEGGALVLADSGLCCIDEFDKMDDYDRSAIYEVMEQQTVSIAKAGHCSSMSARSAVLAAANPVNGVYDVKKSVFVNMNLPAALLTRFDLQFLLLDRPDKSADAKLAEHVVGVLRGTTDENAGVDTSYEAVDMDVMRAYIALAKEFEPKMTQDIVDRASEWYISRRSEELQDDIYNGDRCTYTTPRSMLAVLRISQALARLRFSETITMSDFEEAVRLTEQMKNSLTEALKERRAKKKAHPSSQIFNILRRMRDGMRRKLHWDGWLDVADLERQIVATGLKPKHLREFIETYKELDVVYMGNNDTQIAFREDIIEAA